MMRCVFFQHPFKTIPGLTAASRIFFLQIYLGVLGIIGKYHAVALMLNSENCNSVRWCKSELTVKVFSCINYAVVKFLELTKFDTMSRVRVLTNLKFVSHHSYAAIFSLS